MVSMHAKTSAILMSQSTTMRATPKPFKVERSTMKSSKVDFHALSRSVNGCSNPFGRCQGVDQQHAFELQTLSSTKLQH